MAFEDYRSSIDSPIRVDWVATDVGPGRGRIGATFAPGKKGRSQIVGGTWDRDLGRDLDRLRDEWRCDLLVSLIEDFELDLLGIRELVPAAQARGIAVLRVPVVDGGVPTLEQARWATDVMLAGANAGRHVVAHCRGGLGRAGTFAACCRVRLGDDPTAAIANVRAARHGSIENAAQEAFVIAFAGHLSGA